ncbi:MAG: glycosyltransferase, partial [Planctomycetes bacterium]|nr:glycosyltransferase [Planctomycetota bacterium]
MKVSIVVPLYNEKENVAPLIEAITAAMAPADYRWELILVDDGSIDGTMKILEEMQKDRPNIKVIEFRRNFGQTAAMAAGFNYAVGEVVVPMDGDLQNDPVDIP